MNSKLTPIGEIKENPNNPRIIQDERFEKLVQSIKDFPKMLELRPIVVNDDMIVLGGNMRLKACRHAGLKEVPVIKATDLTEEEQRQFIIKDNVGFGEWDWKQLIDEWDQDELEEWGLDIPEYQQEKNAEAEEDEYEIPDEIDTDIVVGDLFQIGPHRLMCGSSTEVDTWEKLMEGEQADMVMTDPPYNVNYEGGTGLKIMNDKMADDSFYQFLYDFYTALNSFTKPGGAWYVWHADSEGVNFRMAFQEAGILLKQCLIWVKNSIVLGRQDYQWKHEPCLYGWKPGSGHYFIDERTHSTVIEDKIDLKKLTKKQLLDLIEQDKEDKQSTTVIRCDKPIKNDVHPTMKPILLLSPLIKNSSRIGEIVCDGFLGSGSTMVASHQLQRRCYGMELDPKYCQVIIDRMNKLDPTIKITRNGQDYIMPDQR
jgi:site-specific DNA-methyltransferase (adenine-specific)